VTSRRTFSTGQPIIARPQAWGPFKTIFTSEEKTIREPISPYGYKNDGTWDLGAKAFFTTWQHAKRACFTVIPNGEHEWAAQKGAKVVPLWTK
jgi:hypothetical protein